jgi:hypothetical protein
MAFSRTHCRRIADTGHMPGGARAARNPARATIKRGFLHSQVGYNMWRGNHSKYTYTRTGLGRYGESGAMAKYHQYFSHAKDPTDVWKSGREYEYLRVERGKPLQKPLPQVQYVNKDSKPTWLFKSWSDPFDGFDLWQREVQYPEHIPTHVDAKRSLAVLAPSTRHTHMHLAYMNKITITVSPFVFGFGNTAQKTALDFYRSCLSSRAPFPNDKVFLFYAVDAIAPRIQVEWINETVFEPVIYDRMQPRELVQQIMERAWLQADIIASSGAKVPALAIDDYKWHEVLSFKKKKAAAAAAAGGAAAGKK